jgi:hypothetical protein
MDVVKKNILIGFATNLGSGLGGILIGRNLSWSLALPIITTRVVGTPQMVFTNPIMTTHVNKTTYRPLMSSMAIGGYKNANATN